MQKRTILTITFVVLLIGGLFYQFVLHPNPYTGRSLGEDVGIVDGQ
jgi:hypothetical protein